MTDAASSAPNPYAPPETVSELVLRELGQHEFQVEGDCIIVGPKATLPLFCVKTGEVTTEADRIHRTLEWSKPFRLVLSRHRCSLSYCVNQDSRRLERQIKLILMLPICAGFFYLLNWYFVFAAAILLPFAFHTIGCLKIKQAQDGRFRVAGCCEEFLAACVKMQADNSATD